MRSRLKVLGYKKHIKRVRAGDSPTAKIDSVGLAGAALEIY